MAFSFGAPAASSTGGFSFGSSAKTTAPSLFGSTTTTSASTGFGGFGGAFGAKSTATASTGLFGSTSTTGGGLFSGFGAKTTASTGFGSFGTTTSTAGGGLFGGFGAAKTTSSLFGSTTTQPLFGGATAQPQAPAQQNMLDTNPLQAMTSALTTASLYGDERDGIIARLNQLQALWGTGKAYYAQGATPVELCPENPFCRFKAVGYAKVPSASDEDGFVGLELKHSESYVKTNQQALVESIHKVLNNETSLSVCVDGVRSLPGDKSEVVIYVIERQPNGASKRILATQLYGVFTQAD